MRKVLLAAVALAALSGTANAETYLVTPLRSATKSTHRLVGEE